MSHNVTPPPMPGFPPPPLAKKNHTNTIIIGSAAAVIAAIVAVGVTFSGSQDDAKPAPTVTVTETVSSDDTTDTSTEDTEPAAEESTSDDGVYALDDTVSYETGVDVTLSGFTRRTSSQNASPADKPYARFNVKIENKGTEKLDTTQMVVNCSYGKDGKSSEAIFDVDLGGGPSTRLLPGRSINVSWGCELPKVERLIQIEVAPDYESETAIFTGTVK
ncbi:hypothetical protein [Streptomyces sp. NPDC059271]|uniref:hypothetical protein n=1 Tax=unclassified Streptomyces TaxID=2593676 RepID=UPI003648EC96